MSSSISSASMTEKKVDDVPSATAALHAVDTGRLSLIKEEDSDEALKIAGGERQVFTREESDAVKRKVDRRIMPLLAAVYFGQFLDKNSLNYSSVMGLPIKGEHYNLVSMAFYLGFLAFELPTSAISQHFPLAKYLGVNMVLWATFLILHAASSNFPFFFVMRFLLGMTECCVSPILISMIAAWYPKDEQAKRVGMFYVMNGVTQIVGGLMAYGVTFYDGTAVSHWRIMYFLLGGLAFVVAASVLIWLPDSPATASFLSPREKLVAIERVRDNQTGTRNQHFKRYQAVEAVTDPKTWLLVLLTLFTCTPNGGLASFNSILIKGFGFSSRVSLLLNLPEGAVLCLTVAIVCYYADARQSRMVSVLMAILPTVLGMALLVGFSTGDGKHNRAALIVGIMLAQTYGAGLAIMYAWSASNIGGSTKKTVVNALFLLTFALSNVIGTQIFQSKDAPLYVPGKIAILVLFSASIPTLFAMRAYTSYLNKKKDKQLAELIALNGWSEEDVKREADKTAFLDLSDGENVFMRYTN
ncbi:hypothetical protein JCM21900_006802 [Sporobolomyces salmonicolor]